MLTSALRTLAFLVTLVIGAGDALAQTAQSGSDASEPLGATVVSTPMVVQVKNPDGVDEGDYHFAFNEKCEVDRDGVFEFVSEIPDTDLYLVDYVGGTRRKIEGFTCPDGTLTTLTKGTYNA